MLSTDINITETTFLPVLIWIWLSISV